MKKILSILMVTLCMLQIMAYAETEFIQGVPPEAAEIKPDAGKTKAHEKLSEVNGVIYVNNLAVPQSNPVPYDEALTEIIDMYYIITDDYYLAFDHENIGAISANAYIPFTSLFIYDKEMNLLHEENFGGGVCIRDAGYFNGVFYCKYTEKLVRVIDESGDYYIRSFNPYFNRNDSLESTKTTTVKSTDMVNWEECDESIPFSNSRTSILGDKISLYEKQPIEVIYENGAEYTILSDMCKFGDWFIVYEYNQEDEFVENFYLSNDSIYFVPLEIPAQAKEIIRDYDIDNFDIYEYDEYIIVSFPYIVLANSECVKHYLKISKQEVYTKLEEIKNAPYVQFQDKILGFETPPVLEADRTLVPMRFLFEQMAAEVTWDDATQSATATMNDTAVTFGINNTTARVNSANVSMDVPARLINDKTMVPLRFLSEELGYTVTWDEETNTAIIE